MPYIAPEERRYFEKFLKETPQIKGSGQLNYIITSIFQSYLQQNPDKYQTYNDIIGVLECAKLELYRRKTQILENQKIKENGDVYN